MSRSGASSSSFYNGPKLMQGLKSTGSVLKVLPLSSNRLLKTFLLLQLQVWVINLILKLVAIPQLTWEIPIKSSG